MDIIFIYKDRPNRLLKFQKGHNLKVRNMSKSKDLYPHFDKKKMISYMQFSHFQNFYTYFRNKNNPQSVYVLL